MVALLLALVAAEDLVADVVVLAEVAEVLEASAEALVVAEVIAVDALAAVEDVATMLRDRNLQTKTSPFVAFLVLSLVAVASHFQ